MKIIRESVAKRLEKKNRHAAGLNPVLNGKINAVNVEDNRA